MKIEGTAFGEITVEGRPTTTTWSFGFQARLWNGRRSFQNSSMVPRACSQETKPNFTLKRANHHWLRSIRQCAPLIGSRGLFRETWLQGIVETTAEAIRAFNRTRGKRIGLFHVTCRAGRRAANCSLFAYVRDAKHFALGFGF